jgi:hypothetical protein
LKAAGDDSVERTRGTDRQNRVAVRGVNERIAASSQRFGGDDTSFVCECDDPQVRQTAEQLNPRAQQA